MHSMHLASARLDLRTAPDWVLWLFAVVGAGLFAATLMRMMPRPLRFGSGGRSVAIAIVGFFVAAGLSRGNTSVLWFGGSILTLVCIPLFWMGPLPDDMPSARDPAARRHPRYAEIERRGRRAGYGLIGIIVVDIVLTAIFVRGI